MAPSVTTGSLCGACKFLRRKCASDCIFALTSVRNKALHARDRCEAVVSIAYEAQARFESPFMVALLTSSPCNNRVKAQLAQNAMNSHTMYGQWEQNLSGLFPSIPNDPISPQSSLESVEVELNSGHSDTMNIQEMLSIENFAFHGMRPSDGDLGELQGIALRMMRH
ncbi:Poly(ADP-ribose) polymerase 2 isoform 1 [Hibiscus syriacus]|uniref:Poly(ADP-ribose) polymerase 2 isoform 1 n=1 Tax=Hibiscus syriacus TaxID=106335 RepID=A0A6A2Z0D1_HIBSY|nr:Poly(ADP-ribose) polymerase 2 isoform 1 [Hibiscus syriacus]